jgi:DNA (cytosine-5)-methyltransferase 1
MRHGSLFSGIGGFDLAAEWMGWENVFHCEWMEFPRKVLDYHFPNADSHIDICKTDFTKYANTIDILTGGFPCQPFSLAGKRKGTDDERYLWGEMLRAIQEIKPRFVIAENVFGITNIDGGLVFQQVCLDLENEGYEVQPFIIPACAKNAPHRRDRCWFIATNTNIEQRKWEKGGFQSEFVNGSQIATNTNCNDGRSTDRKGGFEESKANGEGEQSFYSRTRTTSNEGDATNSNCNGLNERNGNDEINSSEGGEYAFGNIESCNGNGVASNTGCIGGLSRREDIQSKQSRRKGVVINGRERNVTNTSGRGIPRYGRSGEIGKFQTNELNENNRKRQPRMDWEKFPTQSPICGGDDGLPTELDGITFSKWRAESIKGYGNAIVPQIAYQLFQIINDL